MPETSKMIERAKARHTQEIGYFLDWLRERDFTICFFRETDDGDGYFLPISISIERLLADYVEVDTVLVEMERTALLEYMRGRGE